MYDALRRYNTASASYIMSKKLKGTAAGVGANVIFGFAFLASKKVLAVSDLLIAQAVRFDIAFLLLTVPVMLGMIKVNYRGGKLGGIIALSVCQPLLYFVFEQYGVSRTSSAFAGVMIALVPVCVMLLSYPILGEKPTALQMVFTAVSFAGVSVVSLTDGENANFDFIGFLLLLCAVVCAALNNCISRIQSARFSAFERLYFAFGVGAAGLTSLAFAVHGGDTFRLTAEAFSHSDFIWGILYLAVVSSIFAFLLINVSLSYISPILQSSFANIATVVSVLAGVLVLDESFSPLQYLCVALIVVGVLGVNYFAPKMKDEHK